MRHLLGTRWRLRLGALLLVDAVLLATAWLLLRGGWLAPDDPNALLRARFASTRLLDRHGQPLREWTGDLHTRARPVPLAAISPHLVAATLTLEDRRFYSHLGVDSLAIARATWTNLRRGRVVSGASTLTQQLVKQMQPRPRTLFGKAHEALVALHLEARFDKHQILHWYLTHAPYGGLVRGAEQAAQRYLGKPARDLTVAEAAWLAVLPRAPGRLDPLRFPGRALPAQRALLHEMAARGQVDGPQLATALAQPIRLAVRVPASDPLHFADFAWQALAPLLTVRPVAVQTTLDAGLQRDLQAMVTRHVAGLRARDVDQAAVVVLDAAGEVRAMVGSAGAAALGANNGATARRQPGSTLKAFTYALAFDSGTTAATLLPDVAAAFDTDEGVWTPQNYGEKMAGPLRARLALAGSVNLAAVRLLERVGVERLRSVLAALGFHSLARGAAHYGLALTLGDGEVTLLELTNAYAAFARGGLYSQVLWLQAIALDDGTTLTVGRPETRRVFSEAAAFLVADVLADPRARRHAFGRGGALELPFAAAVKTGTSKGFRDNWAVGWTGRWTVGVWVGNFDGRPMRGVSGVTGAGPLWRDVMLRVAGGDPDRGFMAPAGLARTEICPLSGALHGPHCPQATQEWFAEGTRPQTCAVHQAVAIDRRNGLRAGSGCPQEMVRTVVATVLPPEFAEWSRQHAAGDGSVPDAFSPLCPGGATVGAPAMLRIVEPRHGATYRRDSRLADAAQALPLRATGGGSARVRWFVDGREVGQEVAGHTVFWPLRAGRHRVEAEAGGAHTGVAFEVESAR